VAASLQAVTPRFDQLAGWTGLATPKETGDQSLSWFVGYAPADGPRFAIVVVVEDSDGGATLTLPIARQMLASMSP
jgi:cell division protein FtsI/penicillin-binding protein 2